MLAYIFRNLLQRCVLLFIVSILAHSVVHLAPGEPSEVDPSNPRMQPEDIAKIRAAFHLDDPIHLQYMYWMRDLFTGELKSFKDSQPVLPKIWERFLNSLPLFICATLLVWTLAFPTGIHAAIRRNSAYDRGSTFVAYALISVPGFFLSYIMILFVVDLFGVPV
ncbi:MAG: ABC transporter permease, partial [Proteobacteria bacterium]|nr:ABC transporter permease [Pseudomonadota bacterium]